MTQLVASLVCAIVILVLFAISPKLHKFNNWAYNKVRRVVRLLRDPWPKDKGQRGWCSKREYFLDLLLMCAFRIILLLIVLTIVVGSITNMMH
jgi:hypothetical protein